jgi:tRNA-splicing ligase RtcB
VPVGRGHHSKSQDVNLMPNIDSVKLDSICSQEYNSALKQIGTLGGGNHFIELQKDTEDKVWIMIHSGSRNLGYKVANHYNDIAIELNEQYYSQVPKNWELAFLPSDSDEAQDYFNEMNYCVEFALANRKLMMDNIIAAIRSIVPCDVEPMINIAHNYARMENHFGKNVMVHRKGATSAREGEIGIIPGSQGTKSYIVKGKGNILSLQSCSHGAGRKMSRTKAQNELNLNDEIKRLDDQGIVHGIRTSADLDEASGAYKSIDDVMRSQAELVEIVTELSPIAVIKG